MYPASKDSMAYDLSMFDEVKREKTTAEYKKKLDSNAERRPISLTKVVWFFVFFVTLAAILYNYTQLTEVSAQVSSLKKELSTLKEEERRLSVMLDSKTNLKMVDEYARGVLGMAQITDGQIEYINISNEEMVMVSAQNDVTFEKIASAVAKSFNAVVEYLN